jgi:3-hydroxybutyryl-CoA dehydrogenase
MRAAVLGAGVMGRNIARVLLCTGSAVALYSRTQASLDRARSVLSEDGVGDIQYVRSITAAVAGAQVVIESVPESLPLKQAVLAEAQRAAPENAVIATNTSSLPLERLAEGLDRPERFLGWHWFNPAHLIPLVEVIPVAATEDDVVAWSLSHLTAAGKRPTLAPAIDGFLVNRLQYALIREALALVEDGHATPEQIDAALTDCLGPRWAVIGPMRSTDLAGVPTAVAVARRLFPQLCNARAAPRTLTDLESQGRLGAAAGAGFYDYDGGSDAAAERDRRLTAVLRVLAEA